MEVLQLGPICKIYGLATQQMLGRRVQTVSHTVRGCRVYSRRPQLANDFRVKLTRHSALYSPDAQFISALHGMPARTSDEKGVCLSVRLTNACIVTKRKKDMSGFLYHTKDHLA